MGALMLDLYLDSYGDAPWSMKDIPYHTLDRELVRDDALLLYIIASASFIEITSDLLHQKPDRLF